MTTDVQTIINAGLDSAADALEDARTYSASAQSAAATVVYPGSSGTITWTKPTLLAPVVANQDLGAVFLETASNAFNELGPEFLDQFHEFVADYFPDIDGCIRNNSDNWICDTIVNGGTGIPAAIQDAIWNRGRDAILKEVAAARDVAFSDIAARGFTVPPGALSFRLAQIDQTRIDKSAEIARDIAIKNIEIEIENIRFAVQQAVQLRLGAATAAINFVRAYVDTYNAATERGKAMVAARVQLWNSVNDYYRAFAAIEQLDIEVKKTNVSQVLADNQLFVKAAADGTAIKTNAALAAAKSLGAAAAAALGANNSLVYDGQTQSS